MFVCVYGIYLIRSDMAFFVFCFPGILWPWSIKSSRGPLDWSIAMLDCRKVSGLVNLDVLPIEHGHFPWFFTLAGGQII